LFHTGKEGYGLAAVHMGKAMARLREPNHQQALKEMALAEEALSKALNDLLALMEALERIPAFALIKPPEDMELGPLTQALILAAEQRRLRGEARASVPRDLPGLGPRQAGLRDRCAELTELVDDELVRTAHGHMAKAVPALEKPRRAEAIRQQQLAEKFLRRFVLQTALEMMEEPPEELSEQPSVPMPSIMPVVMTTESLHLFSKTAAEGKLTRGKRAEWEVLGRRDRAALNENFARELPLEFRGILKDYYERLAK
jgi:hypothetical protein